MEGLPPGYRPNVGVCLINSDDQICCFQVSSSLIFYFDSIRVKPVAESSNLAEILQVFVASRLNVPGAWQMPQGGIEEGEEPKLAAIRELREETGITSAESIAEVPNWLTYDFPPAVKAKVNRLWGGEWHGQAQKCLVPSFCKVCLVRFLGGNKGSVQVSFVRLGEFGLLVARQYPSFLISPPSSVVFGDVQFSYSPVLVWFLMRLTNGESEVNLATGEADPEFSEWKWATPEEVIEQAVDYKRPTYEEVMRTFKPYFNSNKQSARCKSTKW
ncbi:hypothetical protein TIFTF001_007986 [Ficus carica]|uniref:Nudix hydrolase domain-containing protein n=1 Tax=Ficus carica TaxID=3494 RepID=A0AA88A7P5_FICCA|nr:hypothetical protein TIFTF001_007986 [Ficus carica]